MIQITIRRSHLMIATTIITLLLAVAWTGVASRASAASSTPVVYVATGVNFPDALGAASAAAVQGGPVLLVTKTSIPTETKNELKRLSPNIIYVAGGTAVVSDTVFNQLKAYAPTVKRVAGANRYATAAEVSKSAFPVTGGASTAALEARIHELETLLAGVTRNGNTLTFTGMNLQVVNGEGQTGTSNGLGNVIIGYNETPSSAPTGYRDGSHYLIVGAEHHYTAFGGIVAGYNNAANGAYASVTGGHRNIASGDYSSATGGSYNTANGNYSSVGGGYNNIANGDYASITGGESNTAKSDYSSVTGGRYNKTNGSHASVTGGYNNDAAAADLTIVGGDNLSISLIPWGSGAVAYGEGTMYSADTNG